MRFLTSLLLSGLLLAVAVTPGVSNSSPLQQFPATRFQSLNTPHRIVKNGHPGHRGSGRLESSLGMAQVLG
jgi:hypothetical protein